MGNKKEHVRYEKPYFQGPNLHDGNMIIKFTPKQQSKNIARKSKRKK